MIIRNKAPAILSQWIEKINGAIALFNKSFVMHVLQTNLQIIWF